MKPSSFSYEAPSTIEETTLLLSEQGDEAKVLAGGQSLVPMMNYRLARPSVVIDVNELSELRFIESAFGEVRVGALARHSDLLSCRDHGAVFESFRKLGPHIGHAAIRNRGTVCGSLVHADPAAEWCVLARALDATIVLDSCSGSREVLASDFFEGLFTTAIRADEFARELRIPSLPARTGIGFQEISRRSGDFAIVMAFVAITATESQITDCRIALGGVDSVPLRATEAESILSGSSVTDDSAIAAASASVRGACDPPTDVHATSQYRSHVAQVLTERALAEALSAALESPT